MDELTRTKLASIAGEAGLEGTAQREAEHVSAARIGLRPPLTIGLPVYNGGATVARALDMLLAQTFQDFVLLISNNHSTDGTADIIQDYASRDSRIRLLDAASHVSAPYNFKRLVDAAETEFFMFAPADDMWDPRFAQSCMDRLRRDAALSLCSARTAFVDANGEERPAKGTFQIDGNPAERMGAYLSATRDNSRFYGIHRTAHLKEGFRDLQDVVAWDWLVLLPGLRAGSHAEVPELLLRRQRTPRQSYRKLVSRTEKRLVGRVFPALPVSRIMAERMSPAEQRQLRYALVRMNLLTASISPYLLARGIGYIARAAYLGGDMVRTLWAKPHELGVR